MAPQAISNNVIKMLPAPNLATGRPNVVQQSGTSQVVQGSFGVQPASSSQSAQDSYGIPQGGVITGRGNINDIVSSVSGGGGGATPNSGPSPGSVVQLANTSPTIVGNGGDGSSAQGGTTEFGQEMQLKGRGIARIHVRMWVCLCVKQIRPDFKRFFSKWNTRNLAHKRESVQLKTDDIPCIFTVQPG